MKNPKTICLDFDGVIHKYSKAYHDGSIYDEPVKGTKKALETFLEEGFKVVVHTARPNWEEIKGWMVKHFGEEIAEKVEVVGGKPIAFFYVDDRAVRFTNWRDILNYIR